MLTGGILFDGEVAADRPVTIALEHGGVRFSGPGTSESRSWRPPTRSRGNTASASTMMPIPPSHCVNCLHSSIE